MHELNSRDYLFTSERLGFRNWKATDVSELAEMNADTDVMEHFPKPLTFSETAALLERLQEQYAKNGYTYFATELLESGEFIGFIGMAYQEYETVFTPATDIGWRLKTSAWGKGYATEGALRCLEFAFDDLKLSRIISTCTQNNSRSENVMKKAGMSYQGVFNHPNLKDYPEYERCVWYDIVQRNNRNNTISPG
jgi:RimJ/RimL family protein N-acetyltransferase